MTEPDAEPAQEGFGLKTLLGVLFLGTVILPGAIYLSLVTGQNIGPAAEWVTVILFAELARRSMRKLRKQEIFILFYAAGTLMVMIGGMMTMGGPFAHLIWNQFVAGSREAELFGLTKELAKAENVWIAPNLESEAIRFRNLLHADWMRAITVTALTFTCVHLQRFALGFIVFKVTSDRERLPFPLAEVGAAGTLAIAESFEDRASSGWRFFSIGVVMGCAFGAIYIVIPAVTGTFLARPLALLPIPWIDFSDRFDEHFMPAALFGINTDPTIILIGMILPFEIVIGQFASSIGSHLIANPLLHRFGILKRWQPMMTTIPTAFANNLDFWMSFGIGTAGIVLLVGIWHMVIGAGAAKKSTGPAPGPRRAPGARREGDVPLALALFLWALTGVGMVLLVRWLVPGFPVWITAGLAFLVTPLYTYIQARMIGITGRDIGFPYIREATIMLSGYKASNIWFAPLPLMDFGGMAQTLRVAELTKTRIWSLLKTEICVLPIVMGCSLLFWAFLWRLNPIPSPAYVFASRIWPQHAYYQVLWATANLPGGSRFMLEAIRLRHIAAGAGVASVIFVALSVAKLPAMYFYGAVSGLGMWGWPHASVPMFAGALMGKFIFQRRFGRERWRKTIPVLTAGFVCGMGLTGMLSAAISMMAKAVVQLPY